jgi:fructose-1,6-bisphosphatase I
LAVVASEDDEEPTILRRGVEGGKYCVIFDPLDGSSNLDVCASVGTIFSILRNDPGISGAVETLCQPGTRQVAAGYILYGSSTVFVLTTGNGVDMFVLDPAIGSFVLVKSKVAIPQVGRTYSVNEANRNSFPAGFGRYLDWAHQNGYSSRYIGSMVADFHRTLLTGGIFMYPPTNSNPDGKLRLLYEANPIAFIAEQAGGIATDGKRRILDIVPKSIHERTPLAVGSTHEMGELEKCLEGDRD